MPAPRTRSKFTYGPTGSRIYFGGQTWQTEYYDSFNVCRDTSGKVRHQPLEINSFEGGGGIINGSTEYASFDNYPCDYLAFTSKDRVISTPNRPSDSELVVKLLAKTNPSTPQFGVATSLAELKDFPGMIRDLGNIYNSGILKQFSSIKGTSSAYLQWKFGWEPIIRDLLNVTKFHDAVHRRFNRLKNLKKSGRETMRRVLWKQRDTHQQYMVYQSLGVYIDDMSNINTYGKVSGYVDWVLDNPDALPSTNPELMFLASNIALGLRPGLTTMWNLLPWSFIIDWFSNLSDYITMADGQIDCHFENLRLMDNAHQVIAVPQKKVGPYEMSLMWLHWESKTRWIPKTDHLLPTFKLPVLSPGQLSIVGALIGARRSERYRLTSSGLL